ncbi:MAG: hypothetical protein JW966_03685 [Anaerolineae bacterium]|nr:hypothetical protein [Anaerolineae bacterium]
MAHSSEPSNVSNEFFEYFKAGKEAAKKGANTKAHELFRKAIELDPYHEVVWLWLASVVETDADRRVCFENVLELNPTNPTARRQLVRMGVKNSNVTAAPATGHQKRRRWVLRLLVAGLGITTVIMLVLLTGLI